MKKIVFLAFLAAALALPAKVTLSQAVANAWKISPTLDSQQLEEEAAAIAAASARRQKYFSVFFGGSYRYVSDKVGGQGLRFSFPGRRECPAGDDGPFRSQQQFRPETVLCSSPFSAAVS